MVQRPAITEHNPKVDGKTAQHARSTAFVMHSIRNAQHSDSKMYPFHSRLYVPAFNFQQRSFTQSQRRGLSDRPTLSATFRKTIYRKPHTLSHCQHGITAQVVFTKLPFNKPALNPWSKIKDQEWKLLHRRVHFERWAFVTSKFDVWLFQRLRAGRFDLERFTKLLGQSFGFGLSQFQI